MPNAYYVGKSYIRIQRLAEKSAMPESFLKDINEILGIDPKWKWTWHDKLIVTLPNRLKFFLRIISNLMFLQVLKN